MITITLSDRTINYYPKQLNIGIKMKTDIFQRFKCNHCNNIFSEIASHPTHLKQFLRYWTFCKKCGSSASLVKT